MIFILDMNSLHTRVIEQVKVNMILWILITDMLVLDLPHLVGPKPGVPTPDRHPLLPNDLPSQVKRDGQSDAQPYQKRRALYQHGLLFLSLRQSSSPTTNHHHSQVDV